MGQPKDRLVLKDGRLMICHVLEPLLEIVNKIVIAGPILPIFVPENTELMFVPDKHRESGPIGGVEAILSSNIANGYIIAGCDQPLLTKALVSTLISPGPDTPCFFETDVIQPFPGYFPASWLAKVQNAINDGCYSLKHLISNSDVKLIPLSAKQEQLIRSFNHMEDVSSILL